MQVHADSKPVSYTHLDVYKRQPYHHFSFFPFTVDIHFQLTLSFLLKILTHYLNCAYMHVNSILKIFYFQITSTSASHFKLHMHLFEKICLFITNTVTEE